MDTTDVLIIGAGISGLLCATELKKRGLTVTVLDKGRGVGGRMATRRMAGARLDHGAQYFTVRSQRFQLEVDAWLRQGTIREWFRKLPEDSSPGGHPRYIGHHGLSDLPKALASNLDVMTQSKVVRLRREGNLWFAEIESGTTAQAPELVLTAPLPQSIALLDTSKLDWAGEDADALRSVRYAKGLATLVILEGPSVLAPPGGMKVSGNTLSWIADNQQKGISPDIPAVTLHATSDFAEAHWDSPDKERGPLMLEAAKPFLQQTIKEYTCHRWGYTTPLNPYKDTYYRNETLGLTLAGDAFGGLKIENAALSGLEAADRILGRSYTEPA